MEPLATDFRDRTFQYTQVERQGLIAIFVQCHKDQPEVKRYEVIRIRVRPAHTWPNGTMMPEHESYPSPSAWGQDGFTCFSFAEAKALALTLP